MQDRTEDRSIGQLFADLARDTSTLIRQEVQLAKTEVTQKASETGKNVGFLAVGGFVAYAGFLAILAAIILGLWDLGLPGWLSALIVGLVVALIGYVLVQRGLKNLRQGNLAPTQTVETIKEDVEWMKEQTR